MLLRIFRGGTFFLFGVMLLCSASAYGETQASSWEVFQSKPGRFSVAMPHAPERLERRTKSFIGNIVTYVFLARAGNEEFSVAYSDLPGFAVAFAGSSTIYDHAKGALLMETLGKEQRFVDATLNGIRGKHLVYDAPDPKTQLDMRGEAYFFLVDKRLYVLDANLPVGDLGTDAPRFLSSFRID